MIKSCSHKLPHHGHAIWITMRRSQFKSLFNQTQYLISKTKKVRLKIGRANCSRLKWWGIFELFRGFSIKTHCKCQCQDSNRDKDLQYSDIEFHTFIMMICRLLGSYICCVLRNSGNINFSYIKTLQHLFCTLGMANIIKIIRCIFPYKKSKSKLRWKQYITLI